MKSPLSVGAIITSISYDGVAFAKAPSVSDGTQHDIYDYVVSMCDPESFVG